MNFCVINKTKQITSDSVKITKQYYFGDTEKLLVGYTNYGGSIKLGNWNRSLVEINVNHEYNEQWAKIIKMLRLPPGCNAVDIGANDGKSWE